MVTQTLQSKSSQAARFQFQPLALFAVFAAASGLTEAAPIYQLHHNPDNYSNTAPQTHLQQNSPINYFYDDTFDNRNFATVTANASNGSLGISTRTFNNGIYRPLRNEVSVSFSFDVIFSSPNTSGPINVAMNLDLSGIVDLPGDGYGTIKVDAGTGYSAYNANIYHESLNQGDRTLERNGIMSDFVADGTKQTLTTNWMTVAANQPTTLLIAMKVISGYSTTAPSVDFGHTLSLTTLGDVFTIDNAFSNLNISVNSVDAGIVDNRFSQNINVPIPGMGPIFGLGLIVLWARQRKTAA